VTDSRTSVATGTGELQLNWDDWGLRQNMLQKK